MTSKRAIALGLLGFVLQLAPLAMAALWLFVTTKPGDRSPSGITGVMAYQPLGSWYAYPLSIVLGIHGILASFWRLAAMAAAIPTLLVLAYGLRLWLPGADPGLGQLLVALSAASLVGLGLRLLAWREGREPQSLAVQ